MPKLRKHAQLKQNRTETEESQQSFAQTRRPDEESRSRPSLLIHPPKMKYRDRAALISSYENSHKVESESNNMSIRSSLGENSRVQDQEIDNYLSKFKDDDEFSGEQRASGHQKKKKKGIRVSNKFFADHNFEDQLQELPPEQLELVIQRKENKNVDHLLAKVERKAQGIKNRLEFKNAEHDQKVKQDIRHKLKSIQDCEEVKLVIEVPQIAATKHIDGALFLKNVKNSGNNDVTLPLEEEESGDIPKDRRLFYQNLTKKMKMKKAETLTESVLKECFKKSRLDNDDFVHDPSQPLEQPLQYSKKNNEEQEYLVKQSTQLSEASVHEAISTNKQQLLPKEEQKPLTTEQLQHNKSNPIVEVQVKQQHKETELVHTFSQEEPPSINSKPRQKQKQNQKQKQKPKKQRGRQKGRKFNVKDLIEEEAEDSDDEVLGHKAKQQQEQDDDEGDLSSLIDDDVTLCEEEEEFAHRKFIKDMIEAEEQNFLRLQKQALQDKHKYEQRHEEQLKKRMQAAAKRNAKKQKMEQQQNSHTQTNLQTPSVSEQESISNAKNAQKLKQLELQIGITKQIPSQQSSTSETTLNKFANLQRLLSIETVHIRKPVTNGLKNVQKFKSKPKITTRIRK